MSIEGFVARTRQEIADLTHDLAAAKTADAQRVLEKKIKQRSIALTKVLRKGLPE